MPHLRQHRRLFRTACAALALFVASAGAGAVEWGMSDSTLTDLSYNATQSLLMRRVLKDTHARARSGQPVPMAKTISTLAPGGDSATTARQLAQQMPPARRAEAEKAFVQLLGAYHQIEARFGIPRNDVGGAVAAFIAGGLMAYRNQDFPDAHFKPLVEQMRGILAADPSWAQASVAAKQDMYEQLAIIGMLVANTQIGLARRSDAQALAAMQAASKNYLEQFLKVDASKVRIDGRGLSVN